MTDRRPDHATIAVTLRDEMTGRCLLPAARRLMRGDIERGLMPAGDYAEARRWEPADRTVELARRRRGR